MVKWYQNVHYVAKVRQNGRESAKKIDTGINATKCSSVNFAKAVYSAVALALKLRRSSNVLLENAHRPLRQFLLRNCATAIGHDIDGNALRAMSGSVGKLPARLSISTDCSRGGNRKSVNSPTPVVT